MAKNSSPSFQFYPSDFLSDSNVIRMKPQERGCYITLMSVCWMDGSIPADPSELALLAGGKVSEKVIRCFAPVEIVDEITGDVVAALVHPRLEKEKIKQDEWREKSAAGGRAKAARRQQENAEEPDENPLHIDTCLGNGRRVAENGREMVDTKVLPNSTLLFSSSSSIKDKRKKHTCEAGTPPVAEPSISPTLRAGVGEGVPYYSINSTNSMNSSFEAFWNAYPTGKRGSKVVVRREWDRLKPDRRTADAMLGWIGSAVRSDRWLAEKGRFVPLAANFLAKRYWEADPPPPRNPDLYAGQSTSEPEVSRPAAVADSQPPVPDGVEKLQPGEWEGILAALRDQVGVQSYNTWFRPIVCVGKRDEKLYLRTPTMSFARRFNENCVGLVKSSTGMDCTAFAETAEVSA